MGSRESQDSWSNGFIGCQGDVHMKKNERTAFLHLKSLGHSQGRKNKGNLYQGPTSLLLVHLVTSVGYSQPVCGEFEASGKYEVLKICNANYNVSRSLTILIGMDNTFHVGHGDVKGEWDGLT